jgi:hypothetical protein
LLKLLILRLQPINVGGKVGKLLLETAQSPVDLGCVDATLLTDRKSGHHEDRHDPDPGADCLHRGFAFAAAWPDRSTRAGRPPSTSQEARCPIGLTLILGSAFDRLSACEKIEHLHREHLARSPEGHEPTPLSTP